MSRPPSRRRGLAAGLLDGSKPGCGATVSLHAELRSCHKNVSSAGGAGARVGAQHAPAVPLASHLAAQPS